MIDLKDFRQNPNKYYDAIAKRGRKFNDLLNALKSQRDDSKKQIELEKLQAEVNAASKIMPNLGAVEKKDKIAQLKPISDQIAAIKKELDGKREIIIPNITKDDVPVGDDESGNVVIREVGRKREIKEPKDYLALTEPLGLIDTKRAGKVSGSRFGYILGAVAQMEFALIQFAQSKILQHEFTMVVPPVMIKEENMAAMGYLSGGGEDETYHFEKDNLYLVGTSEQSIGPMHRDEVLKEEDLPKRYLSFSTCFRREAGSYGKDTKGILRVHQFDKLEMFCLVVPEESDQEQLNMLALAETLWQGLDIPYRVVNQCTGDISWPSARTYDIEAWLPGQKQYREVGSTSTTTDYQSRALNIKVARKNGHKEIVHMLNGTALAIGRTLIAIIENYQRPDGTIEIPKVLRPYMNGAKVIGK
jgi:seryl-tRNA synthetase